MLHSHSENAVDLLVIFSVAQPRMPRSDSSDQGQEVMPVYSVTV